MRKRILVNIRTPKLGISDLRLFALRITYNILFLLLAAGVVYFLFFSEWLQISNVLVEGNKITDKKLILDAVEPFLHKKTLFIFPSNNFFFIPTGQIEREIAANFKRISKVNVSRGFPNSLAIRVEEKKAVLLFCSNNGCTWVDEEGIAYNQSSYAEAIADSGGQGEESPPPKAGDVVIVQDNSHSQLALGQLATDPAYVDFANRVWRSFAEKTGKELAFLSTPLPSAQEIRAHTKEGWTVYLDTTLDLDKNLTLLNRLINQDLKEKEGDTVCLDYIDLRVVDRVFYKTKDNCGSGKEEQNLEASNLDNREEQEINKEQEIKAADTASPPKTDKKKKKKKKN